MRENITWVGMDVHKETIAITAHCESDLEKPIHWELANVEASLRKLVKRLREFELVRCVYEAGPCGYDLYRFLHEHGIPCEIAAPSLIPRKPGDRVKTDRRDSEKLARLYRAGELTLIRIPTPEQEALRDLVRTREDAVEDFLRKRQRLSKFFLRQGRRYDGKSSWTQHHWTWIRSQHFDDARSQTVFEEYVLGVEQEQERLARLSVRLEEEAQSQEIASLGGRLKTLRGVNTITAMTLISEIIDFARFRTAPELMGFVGLVPREYSSGPSKRRGGITKTGNAHLRRVLIEAAWNYRHSPASTGSAIRQRRDKQPPHIIELARKAELRLHRKYVKLLFRGKSHGVTTVAVARELTGFVWALANAA